MCLCEGVDAPLWSGGDWGRRGRREGGGTLLRRREKMTMMISLLSFPPAVLTLMLSLSNSNCYSTVWAWTLRGRTGSHSYREEISIVHEYTHSSTRYKWGTLGHSTSYLVRMVWSSVWGVHGGGVHIPIRDTRLYRERRHYNTQGDTWWELLCLSLYTLSSLSLLLLNRYTSTTLLLLSSSLPLVAKKSLTLQSLPYIGIRIRKSMYII